MTSRIEICSNASVLVGGNKITGFTGSSTEEIVAEALYPSVLANLLSSYRWRFASQYVQLSRDTDAPDVKWDASYQLPAGTTILYGCYVESKAIEFDRIGNKLLCNAGEDDEVFALIGFTPDESLFPPYFTATLELKLAAVFAVPIAEDTQKAGLYEGMAMRQFAQARSVESQGRTPSKMPIGNLRGYHNGGR